MQEMQDFIKLLEVTPTSHRQMGAGCRTGGALNKATVGQGQGPSTCLVPASRVCRMGAHSLDALSGAPGACG